MQRHEQTAVPAGSMGETHPAFYVVATGGSGTSAQGRLERVADSLLFPPFHRREGRYRAGHGDHRAPELGAAGWRRHDIRPSAFRACVENARNEDGQDGAWLFEVGNCYLLNILCINLLHCEFSSFFKIFFNISFNIFLISSTNLLMFVSIKLQNKL